MGGNADKGMENPMTSYFRPEPPGEGGAEGPGDEAPSGGRCARVSRRTHLPGSIRLRRLSGRVLPEQSED